MSGIVDGKCALVVGVANKRSIAWAIARALDAQGARVALTFQGERVEKDVTKLAGELSNQPLPVVPMDVMDEGQMDAAVAAVADALGGIDILVHAVAFARADDLIDCASEPDHDGLCELEQRLFLDAIRNDRDLDAHMEDAVNSLRIVLAGSKRGRL